MIIDRLGRVSFSSRDLIEQIYLGNIDKLSKAKVQLDDQDYIKYLEFLKENYIIDWPIPLPEDRSETDIASFDVLNQHSWLMPLGYDSYRLASYLLDLCKTAEETARVEMELELFEKYNMIELLCYLKFLVDKMRENNILWGVGRGSSVASYCLYLLGIHKIDSLKYNLDIREFFK
jgi:DNA polymerase III alpha subunit